MKRCAGKVISVCVWWKINRCVGMVKYVCRKVKRCVRKAIYVCAPVDIELQSGGGVLVISSVVTLFLAKQHNQSLTFLTGPNTSNSRRNLDSLVSKF